MTDHLATGDIDVQYGNLPEGQDASVDATVALMAEMAKGKFGARSPKIRAAAINIINGIDPLTGKKIGGSVSNKDYFGMLEAIHNYVRDNIRYVKDVVGQETLSYPEETLFNSRGGDCDDMTILEIGLLGSIGLRSYPVVIGLVPGHFSHVYLHAEIPEGRHRQAGKTFAADPIMREWPLGMAAPDARVKAKRVYPHLAGLGTMSGIHGYANGPSYLNQRDELEATQVPAVLRSRITDTGSRGEVVTTKRLTEWGDELDDMFLRSQTLNPMQAAPAFELFNRGPVTNRAEKVMTSYLHQAPISALRGAPAQRGPRIVTVQDKNAPKRKGQVAPSLKELKGLADYINDLAGPAVAASRRHLVNGKSDILHRTAAAAAYTKQRAQKASGRVVNWQQNAGFLFGLGSMEADQRLAAARAIEQLAHQIAAKAQKVAEACAGDSPARRAILDQDFGALAHLDHHLGVIEALVESEPSGHPRLDAQEKIDTLVVIGQNPTFREASTFKAAPPQERRAARPIIGVMPGNAVVRDQNGNVIYTDDQDDGLAGFFSKVKKKVKKVASAPKKAVQSVHKQVKKVGSNVQKLAKNKRIRNIAIGVATAGGSLLSRKTVDAVKKLGGKKASKGKNAAGEQIYQDANGNVITKEQYDALMAQYHQSPPLIAPNAPVTQMPEYPGSTQSFDYGAGDESLTMPQPGGSAIMDPYAMPNEDFGPEDMGPAFEAESATSDYGSPSEESFTTTRDVSESGIEPFAEDAEGEYNGEESSYNDEGGADDDASEGSMMQEDYGYGDEDETSYEEESAPRQSRRHKRRQRRFMDEANVATEDVYEADDLDNEEDGGEGESYDTSEEPPIEGLPAAGGGIGLLALIGVGLYLATRK